MNNNRVMSESERLEYNRVLNNNRVMSESERLEYNRVMSESERLEIVF
jgi:hypothetical protein